MPRDPDDLLMTADVCTSDTSEGEVRVKVGEAAAEFGKAPDVPLYCSGPAFVSVPNEPDADGSACQAFYAADGDGKKVIGCRDNRYADKVGKLEPGDAAIVSKCDARFLLKRSGNSCTLFSKNQSTGKTMMVIVDGEHGEAKIQNGNAFVLVKDDRIVLAVNGGAAIVISKKGVQITGSSFQAATATVQLGDMTGGAGPPVAPPPSPATAVAVGPQPGAVSTKVFAAI